MVEIRTVGLLLSWCTDWQWHQKSFHVLFYVPMPAGAAPHISGAVARPPAALEESGTKLMTLRGS